MRFFLALVLSLVALPVCASSAEDASSRMQKLPPWQWTAQQRIRDRFDPQLMTARLALAARSRKVSAKYVSVIDGKQNPELFFPWELADQLLSIGTLSTGTAEAQRRYYDSFVTAAGWEASTFWLDVRDASSDYREVDAALNELSRAQYASHGASPSRSDQAQLRQRLCTSRAGALARLRSLYGADEFDKFLYTAVAPTLVSWSTGARDDQTLLRVEGGCR